MEERLFFIEPFIISRIPRTYTTSPYLFAFTGKSSIDGGSENTAKLVLYLCELIVARRLVKQVVLSRLMVGHTHSDIDAAFSRIWCHVRVRVDKLHFLRFIVNCSLVI